MKHCSEPLAKQVEEVLKVLEDKERRQDAVLRLNREVIRDCAKAIKHLHTGEEEELKQSLLELEKKIKELRKVGEGFDNISQQCMQEYAEIKCLHSILSKKPIPSFHDLEMSFQPYFTGLCDCVGELRRQVQISLRKKDKKEAERLLGEMECIYDNLMMIKFSSSLVGSLKHKQDVIRSQVEQARSELLR